MLIYTVSTITLLLSATLCAADGNWRQFCSSAEKMYGSCSEDEGNDGPTLYHFANTMTWLSGKTFCHSRGKRLCSAAELCKPSGSSQEFRFDVIPGDNWVPISDSYNDWLEVGYYHGQTCWLHSKDRGNKPGWGTTHEHQAYKGYVYCCEPDPEGATVQSGMRLGYIGKEATYSLSEEHCTNRNMRLCHSSEVCVGGEPVFGAIDSSDQWVAVNDEHNEWVEVGQDNTGRLCILHGKDHGGLPNWGIRTDGQLIDYVGYVVCCPNLI